MSVLWGTWVYGLFKAFVIFENLHNFWKTPLPRLFKTSRISQSLPDIWKLLPNLKAFLIIESGANILRRILSKIASPPLSIRYREQRQEVMPSPLVQSWNYFRVLLQLFLESAPTNIIFFLQKQFPLLGNTHGIRLKIWPDNMSRNTIITNIFPVAYLAIYYQFRQRSKDTLFADLTERCSVLGA